MIGATSAVPSPRASEESEGINIHDLAAKVTQRSPQDGLYAGLFDSDVPQATLTASNPLDQLGSEKLWSSPSPAQVEGGSGLMEIADIIEDSAETLTANTPTAANTVPKDQNFDEDSIVSVSFSSVGPDEDHLEKKQQLLQEFLRIHEKSFYEVLSVSATAQPEEIQAAFDKLSKAFSKDAYSAELLGRDYGKLNIVLATYENARDTLLDEDERHRYNDSLHSSTLDLPNAPSMDADIAFQDAENLLRSGDSEQAVAQLMLAIEISPEEPAYHATLGWALFVSGGQDAHAADAARPHLNHALSIAPDSGLVHEYKGLVHAKLGDDSEAALQHLSKALDADPRRGHALAAIEALHISRNEHRALDRLYRRLLFRIGQQSTAEGAVIWRRMGDLHNFHLRNPDQALVAYREALKRSPDDAELQQLCKDLSESGHTHFFEESDSLRELWKQAPNNFDPIRSMYELAEAGDQHDAKFVAASALVSLEQADNSQLETYRRFRPRFLLRSQKLIGPRQWQQLLHSQDFALVGALYALLSDTIAELHPLREAKDEVAKADEMPNSSLSAEFRATRAYLAGILGVPEPTIYSRADYGRDIHVAALGTPVLLAGYEVVTCTDKLELCCRLGRAMSYLRPGRAIAAGNPSRVLKHAMMACYSIGAPHAKVPDPDGAIAEFRSAIEKLDSVTRSNALEVVAHISHEHPTLNLSRWTRNLARTADRCGLLLCGDLPLSIRCLGESPSTQAVVELLDFGVSSQYMQLRADMGMSIEI